LGKDLKNTHGIPAAPWQLEKADSLTAIMLPFMPEPSKHPSGWSWGGSKTSSIYWRDDRPCDDCRLLEALPYQVGDRIYLQEEWTYIFWGKVDNSHV
jgi:hypothetical protein